MHSRSKTLVEARETAWFFLISDLLLDAVDNLLNLKMSFHHQNVSFSRQFGLPTSHLAIQHNSVQRISSPARYTPSSYEPAAVAHATPGPPSTLQQMPLEGQVQVMSFQQQQQVFLPQQQVSLPPRQVYPQQQLPSLQQPQVPPPQKQILPPQKQVPPPQQQVPLQVPPQKKQVPPPKKQEPPPKKEEPPPKKEEPPPKKQEPPPKKQESPPKKEEPPPKKQESPPKKEVPPPKKEESPPKKQEPPPKKQESPPKKEVPPPKKQVPPQKQDPPLQKRILPPQKEMAQLQKQDPPPKKQDPPPRKQVPPTKKQTPSPKEPPLPYNVELISSTTQAISAPVHTTEVSGLGTTVPGPDGSRILLSNEEQGMYTNILNKLNALTSPSNVQLNIEEEKHESQVFVKSYHESALDLNFLPKFQSVNHFKKSLVDPNDVSQYPLSQTNYFDKTLTAGRKTGMTIFSVLLLASITNLVRYASLVSELIFIAVDFALDIYSFSSGNDETYIIIHFIFIIICSSLVIFDAMANIPCVPKGWCHCVCKDKIDVARVVLPNILLTPILICDLFDVVTGRGFSGEDIAGTLGFFVLLVDGIYTFIILKIFSIAITLTVLYTLAKFKLITSGGNDKTTNELNLYQRRVLVYCIFLIHTFLQSVGNLLMLVTIGFQIRYENQHFYHSENHDMQVHASGLLIFMCIIACILPFYQLFFFMTTYNFWMQESLVSLMVDFENLSLKPQVFLPSGNLKTLDEQKSAVTALLKRVNVENIRKKLGNTIKNVSFCTKLWYPIFNPIILFYLILPHAFCYLLFFSLAGAGYINAQNIREMDEIDGAATFFTLNCFFFNLIINWYLFVVVIFVLLIIPLFIIYVLYRAADLFLRHYFSMPLFDKMDSFELKSQSS